MLSRFISFLNTNFENLLSLTEKIRQNRKYRLIINGILIVLLCLFLGNYLVKEWQTIRNIQLNIVAFKLIIAFVLYGVNFYLFMFCWHILLKSYGIPSSILTNSYIYSSSQITKILPTPAWFITGRLVMYQKEGTQKKTILTSTFLEIFLHLLIGIVFLALINIKPEQPLTWLYGVSLIPIILVIIYPKVFSFSFLELKANGFTRTNVIMIILVYSLTWVLSGPYFHSIISGSGVTTQISIIKFWEVWIISSIFSYIGSMMLGGVGVLREFSITFLLGNLISPPLALVVAAVSRLIMILGNIAWPLVAMGAITLTKRTWQIEQNGQEIVSKESLNRGDK